MHAKLHWTNHTNALTAWSRRTVKDQYLVDRTFQSGKRVGETLRVVPVVMDHGDEFYPRYTPEEVLTYVPHDPHDAWVQRRNAVIEREWPRMLEEGVHGSFIIPHYEAAAAPVVAPALAAAPQQYMCRPQYGYCEPYDGVSAAPSDAIVHSSLERCQVQCMAAQAARLGSVGESDTEVDADAAGSSSEDDIVYRPGGASAAKRRRVLDDLEGGAYFGMRHI